MRVIICIDDNFGMLFGGKRQSRDSRVLEDIKSNFEPIVILPFSEKLIAPSGISFTVKSDISEIKENETVFIENLNPATFSDKIDEIIAYRWNRKYLSDMRCTLDFKSLKKISTYDFVGSSHDKITREVYKK